MFIIFFIIISVDLLKLPCVTPENKPKGVVLVVIRIKYFTSERVTCSFFLISSNLDIFSSSLYKDKLETNIASPIILFLEMKLSSSSLSNNAESSQNTLRYIYQSVIEDKI